MVKLIMPPERDFGWDLKPITSAHFAIHERDNDQFCVVLHHALLRGVTSEMLHWWFLNFTNLRIRLQDIVGYEDQTVPAYWLWHPSDHLNAQLSGALGLEGTAKPGAYIEIQEAMQYLKYGWKYPVNSKLKIFYCDSDGWAMGRQVPVLGEVMLLRIHFKDVFEEGAQIGVQYHYEIVIGAAGNNPLARFANRRIKSSFSPEFFEAWQTHNVIEVGAFENFLPALFAQRGQGNNLSYEKGMNTAQSPAHQLGYDQALFDVRLEGYRKTDNPHQHQGYTDPTFLA